MILSTVKTIKIKYNSIVLIQSVLHVKSTIGSKILTACNKIITITRDQEIRLNQISYKIQIQAAGLDELFGTDQLENTFGQKNLSLSINHVNILSNVVFQQSSLRASEYLCRHQCVRFCECKDVCYTSQHCHTGFRVTLNKIYFIFLYKSEYVVYKCRYLQLKYHRFKVIQTRQIDE